MNATDRLCQYESALRPDYHCQETALPSSEKGYCIFHEKDKDHTEFERRIKEKIKKKDYDFTGYYFPYVPNFVNFKRITFRKDANFEQATFEGRTDFREATFIGNAHFREATFGMGANFEQVTFNGRAYFQKVAFEQSILGWDAFFNRANFKLGAQFEKATFEVRAHFERATFKGGAHFDRATFESGATFKQAIFEWSTVEWAAYFGKATFKEDTRFEEARFDVVPFFNKATFEGNAHFRKTSFGLGAVFNEATFKSYSYFEEASFKEYAHFEEASFKWGADFGKAIFEADVYFSGATFEGHNNFQKATFRKDVHFEMASFRVVEFGNATFRRSGDKEIAYRLSKISYQKEGVYDKAGDCYYGERAARWESLAWWPPISLLAKLSELVFLRLTCGYGERPYFVIGWAFGIIGLFAGLYYQIGHIVSISPDHIFGIGDAFYFSVITFVTLGFGGPWYPSPDHWIKYFVMSEASLGAFFVALFVMTFGRRMMR